jgi:hypothetical protein
MLTPSKKSASMLSTSCLHQPLAELHHCLDLIDDFHDDFSIAIDQTTNGIGFGYLGPEYD